MPRVLPPTLLVLLVLPLGSARPPVDPVRRLGCWIAPEALGGLAPVHQGMLLRLAQRVEPGPRIAACFDGVPPAALREAIQLALTEGQEFQLGNRWTTTATNGSGLTQGAPTTLTYSFVPDGTPINGGAGEPASPSDLFAVFNAAFGSQAAWQNLFHQVFQAWGSVTGITYAHEPNDDGVTLSSAAGVLGVRGDVRIGGHYIDGASGPNILAYNSFPNGGDMVLDTSNSGYFSNSSNNYRRLRNTVAHEHGHGLGIAHVCPANATKLMEPFLSTLYDGIQHDDLLAGQRHYGDAREPNDTPAQASDLGLLGNGTATVTTVSCDDNSDVDFYKFTVSGPKTVQITLTPVGQTYTQGPETSACDGGTTFNSLALQNLGVELRAPNGTTVLASANANPAGQPETIPTFALASGNGPYYVRVFPGTADTVQLYSLAVTIADPANPPFTMSFPYGTPPVVWPGQATTVSVRTQNGTSAPNPATAFLHVAINAGGFTATPLAQVAANEFRGNLPPVSCHDEIRWYVAIAPLSGGAPLTLPSGAPAAAATARAQIGLVRSDFETAPGWTVVNGPALTDGAWERGIPAGDGSRGDPTSDGDGSGQCWLTANRPGNSDVDGDATHLISPVFDLSGQGSVRMAFLLWFDNVSGSNPGTDPFLVSASNNGGTTWVLLETYNQSPDVWTWRSYDIANHLPLTSQMRFRFTAQDPPPGAVVEAGVDAFQLLVCPPPMALGGCGAGAAGPPVLRVNGSVGGSDRHVDVPLTGSITLAIDQPPGNPAPAFWMLFGWAAVPLGTDATSVPGIGTFCFPPCPLVPGNPMAFLLAESWPTGLCGPALLPGAFGAWTVTIPPLGVPLQVALQPLVETGLGAYAPGNAVLVNVFAP